MKIFLVLFSFLHLCILYTPICITSFMEDSTPILLDCLGISHCLMIVLFTVSYGSRTHWFFILRSFNLDPPSLHIVIKSLLLVSQFDSLFCKPIILYFLCQLVNFMQAVLICIIYACRH